MDCVLPKPGDPTCLRCPSGPYTKHGRPRAFVRGLCGACWYQSKRAGTLDDVAGADSRHGRVPSNKGRRTTLAVCGYASCAALAAERGLRRCAAHRGMHTGKEVRAAKVPARVERPCAGCGQLVVRFKNNAVERSFCSMLCKRYFQSGPWSEPSRVRFPKPPKPVKPVVMISCAWCGAESRKRGEDKRFCSRRCGEKAHKLRRRAAEAGVAGEYAWFDVVRLWKKFGERCAYCRESLALPDLQAEHVVPISRGGLNAVSNLLPSCGPCNSSKRDLSLRAWAAWRAEKKLPPVVIEWADDDPLYSHLVFDADDLELIAA